MSQSLLSRSQSVVEPQPQPKQLINPLRARGLVAMQCDRIVELWNADLTSRAIAQKLQRILNDLDAVPLPPDLRDQFMLLRSAIVSWDREEDSLEDIVGQAIDLMAATKKAPPLPKGAPDPSIVVELTNDRISIIKGGHICGKRIGTASYQGRFDRYGDADLPEYPLCRLRKAPSAYIAHYERGGRYLAKA